MPEQTDEAVVRLVQQGDVESFGIIVERYEERLLRYARRFLPSADDARDRVQEVFLKAFTNIQSFDPSRRFSPWLYRVAHNEFVNAVRKVNHEISVSFLDADTVFPHPVAPERADDRAHRRALAELLERSLDRLDVKYKEPLILYYLEEMDYAEISEILHIPVSTVGIRLMRGKAALRTLVPDDPRI